MAPYELHRTLPMMLALAATGCAAAGRSGESKPRHARPAAELGEDHPLRGRIWEVRAGAFIDPATLAERLAAVPFVMLGEKHDNPEHHRLQAQLLAALAERGRRPAVVWEMIPLAKQAALDRYLATHPSDAAGLGQALGWEASGWPPWPLYQPIAQVALAASLPLRAGGLDRGQLLAVMHADSANAPAELQAPPEELQTPLPEAAVAALAVELRQAHCGHSSPRMEQKMVLVQQLKDALMARRLLGLGLNQRAEGAQEEGAVLIAGNGHARRDRGVPYHLRAMSGSDQRRAAAVGIVEVLPDALEPGAYAAGTAGLGPAFDFLWFTTRVDNDDPCARFRERLERRLKQERGSHEHG